MIDFDKYKCKPLGSILNLQTEEQNRLLRRSFDLPKEVRDILVAERTGAYIRGLASSYRLSVAGAQTIARIVLLVALKEKTLAQLPALLSAELKVANDAAQKMAKEIEDDLLAPVMNGLKEYWDKKKESASAENSKKDQRAAADMPNVINLKGREKQVIPPWRDGGGQNQKDDGLELP